MAMTTHEFAKMLLEAEDKPLYVETSCEYQGEYLESFSSVSGLISTRVENGYVLAIDDETDDVNSTYFKKGDVIVFPEETSDRCPEELNIGADDFLYMLLTQRTTYYNYQVDRIGFYKDEEAFFQRMLKHKVKIAQKDGFTTEWKEFELSKTLEWYKQELPERVKLFEV